MTALYPPGCEGTADIPYTLQTAIQRALIFISWDELPDEERPPRWMWMDDEALAAHFEMVKADRERESRTGKSKLGPIEDPVSNAAAKDLLVGG